MNRSILTLLLSSVLLCACTFKYSFTGASISPDASTVSIQPFENFAAMVMPSLASSMTEALQDRFQRQTSLDLIKEDGDLAFDGDITNYVSTPIAVTGDEYASQNRLTITVKMTFTNKLDPSQNYSKTFSAFADYDSNSMLQDVEPTIIPEIQEKLIEDIFNAAVSNW